ncbi:MAG: hypothetical protein ACE5JH_07825 [Acidobacteriota bacterium]
MSTMRATAPAGRPTLVLAATLALAFVAAAGPTTSAGEAGGDAGSTATLRVGQEAPDFTLESPDGASYTLSERRGRKNLVLIFFRGTW